MTSFCRKLKRARCRRTGEKWPAREQPTIVFQDGGYVTLRPTKGWLRMSAPRVRAQLRMASMLS
jgi:hypothetical protein